MDHMFDWTIFSNQSSLRVVVMHVRPPSAHPGFITLNPDKMQRNPNHQKCNPHTRMQAQGLLAKGWGGASDVYVKLKLGDFQRHVTTVKVLVAAFRVFRVGTMTHAARHTSYVKFDKCQSHVTLRQVGTTSPAWNEGFQFDVVSPSASVAITVWCKRT